MEQINSEQTLELEVGTIIPIYLRNLYFFDISPIKKDEKFSIDKFQACYRLRLIFNNAKLKKEIKINGDWITLLYYQGNGIFREYYTGMEISSLPEKEISISNVEDFIQLQDFLKDRQLFFDVINKLSYDSETKEKIFSQIDAITEICSAIENAKSMVIKNFKSKTNEKTGELLSFDYPYIMEENEIYNFEHGISLKRSIKKEAPVFDKVTFAD